MTGIIMAHWYAPLLSADSSGTRFPQLTDQDAWARLPAVLDGSKPPLPVWARILAAELPRTTAACLQLDYAHRVNSPIPAKLRAAMRWTAAFANQSTYGMAEAKMDALAAGVTNAQMMSLKNGDHQEWSDAERLALRFAHEMSVDSDSVTDQLFQSLVQAFGERQTASMVLLMAYSNFQDRLLLSFGVSSESEKLSPPLDLKFVPEAFVSSTTPPPSRPASQDSTQSTEKSASSDAQLNPIADPESDVVWREQSYEKLQQRIRLQEEKPTRLPVPDWDQIAPNLPEGFLKQSSDIIWYRIVFGYAPELAGPFERVMRTAGAESSGKWDRIFGSGLFWVTTKAVECPYCMGHCEMNWEVAGLNREQIADRSRRLSDTDWSSFPPEEQHAYAFARTLAKTPWKITDEDIRTLQQSFGINRAMIVVFNACRYHYMTRISNGFQLTLEKENVFYRYYQKEPPRTAMNGPAAVRVLSDTECRSRMPEMISGADQPLPSWARAVAVHLPRTAAAMLGLDYAHRVESPIDPVLRAKMRWVVASENRCEYSMADALADLKRAGAGPEAAEILTGPAEKWPETDRKPLEFARLLTVAAPSIPDELFDELRKTYGENRVASMVLLAAYGNFQDRILLGLQLPLEESGPLPPIRIAFAEGALQIAPLIPPQGQIPALQSAGADVVDDEEDWASVTYEELQKRLEKQRLRKPRLPVPKWDDVKGKLPAAMAARPTRIVWSLMTYGYAPELQVPWSITTRTMWAERPGDRVLEESLFWVQTRAVECNYCMGHCEMLLEVAGLDKPAVADRTRRLAGSDWSVFPPQEQRAYAYARKLSTAPWTLTREDYVTLEKDFGPEQAMSTFWWLCRGLYMTRVSDGFQLPLEQENVFGDLPPRK
ncbi:MAG: hypothetical protein ACK526_08560 [Planctomyces sp.]